MQKKSLLHFLSCVELKKKSMIVVCGNNFSCKKNTYFTIAFIIPLDINQENYIFANVFAHSY